MEYLLRFFNYTLLCICITFTCIAKNPPQVIFITGPSSSGKTTLAKAIQNNFEEPYLYISLDQIIEMMPTTINQWNDRPNIIGFGSKLEHDQSGHPISTILIGPFAKKVRETFKEICKEVAKQGHYLIIDDIFFRKCDVSEWEEALKNLDVCWVKLIAPLEVLEKRESLRRDRANGCARSQYLHAFHKQTYDFEADTSTMSPEEIVSVLKPLIHYKLH